MLPQEYKRRADTKKKDAEKRDDENDADEKEEADEKELALDKLKAILASSTMVGEIEGALGIARAAGVEEGRMYSTWNAPKAVQNLDF